MKLNQKFSDIGIAYFLMIIVTQLLVRLFARLLYRFAPTVYYMDIMTWVLSLAPMYLIAFPICKKWMTRLPKMYIQPSPPVAIHAKKWFALFCICLGVMYVGNLMGNALVNIISNLTSLDLTFELQDMMMEENLLYTFLFSVIIAPILEEWLFRKVLIDRAIVFGDKTAIFLSGFMFGLFHGNLYQVFYAIGVGCVFAYIYIRTGKLRYSISLHMVINFFGGFVPVLFLRHVDLDRLTAAESLTDPSVLSYVYSHLGTMAGYAAFMVLMFVLGIVGIVKLVISWKKLELRPGEYSAPAKVMVKRIFGNVGVWLFLAACAYMFGASMMG